MSDLTSKIEIGAGGYERPYRYDRITITSSDPEAARRCPPPELARAFSTGPGDTSPRVDTYGAQHGHTGPEIRAYNPACSCCWHGFPHTTDHHDRAIAAQKDG